MGPGMSILVFGASGGLTADVEESCARLGVTVLALVMNRDLPASVLDRSRLCRAGDLPPEAQGAGFVCPLFTPANRRMAVEEALALGLEPAAALIDPGAIVARSAVLGPGCYVNGGAMIGAAGAFGRFVIVNRGAGIGHHAEIGDFVSIGPGATVAGNVRIGPGAMIGAGAVVAPGIAIGADCMVAPGAVVLRDLPANRMAVGNPARVLPRAEATMT